MTCVATQEETIKLAGVQLHRLKKTVSHDDKHTVKEIEHEVKKGFKEIEGDGLTMETCEKVSELLTDAEKASRDVLSSYGVPMEFIKMHVGLMVIHASLSLLLPEGANEGNKPCCPFCPPGSDDC